MEDVIQTYALLNVCGAAFTIARSTSKLRESRPAGIEYLEFDVLLGHFRTARALSCCMS